MWHVTAALSRRRLGPIVPDGRDRPDLGAVAERLLGDDARWTEIIAHLSPTFFAGMERYLLATIAQRGRILLSCAALARRCVTNSIRIVEWEPELQTIRRLWKLVAHDTVAREAYLRRGAQMAGWAAGLDGCF